MRDLQPVRLEIVDQHLAEAAFLAHPLFAARRARGGAGAAGVGRERLVAILRVLRGAVAGLAGPCRALDKTLVEPEIAVVADRDDAAGAGPVFLA